MSRPVLLFLYLAVWFTGTAVFPAAGQPAQSVFPIFVYENGIGPESSGDKAQRIRLVRDLGFDGMEKGSLDGLEETIATLDTFGLKLYTLYTGIDLDNPSAPFDPRLVRAMAAIEGHEAMPWVYIKSARFAPSSVDGDSAAVAIVRELADRVAAHGLRIMLYPHRGYWLERVEDAVRVAAKVNRPNVGLTFNLAHFLAEQPRRTDLKTLAEAAMPYLFAVTINGADSVAAAAERPWKSYIQPLGQGTFDTYAFVKTFVDLGYSGPFGLQCYGIQAEPERHLADSMSAWKRYMDRLAREKVHSKSR